MHWQVVGGKSVDINRTRGIELISAADIRMTEILQMIVGGLVIALGFGSAIAYPRLQYTAIRQMRGAWRGASLVPLIIMAAVGMVTARALAEGSNLWPLVLIFVAPLATLYLVALRFVARRVDRESRR
jgi:hypothetical protein